MSSPSAGPSGLPSNLGTIEAPFLAGMMASCALFGITCSQVVYYYRTYQGDHISRKSLVAFLFVLELVHLILVGEAAHFLYIVCKIPRYTPSIFVVRSTFSASYLITVLITSLVQCFYAQRVWSVAKTHYLGKAIVGIILATTFAQFCLGIAEDAFLFIDPALTSIHGRLTQGIFSSQLAVAMVCDVMISLSLVHFLNQSRSGFFTTENVIDRLIFYSVNVGVVTSAISVVTFATFHALPNSTMFTGFTEVISKIYVNSLLVTLNSRKGLRKNFEMRPTESIQLSGNAYTYASRVSAKNGNSTSATLISGEPRGVEIGKKSRIYNTI